MKKIKLTAVILLLLVVPVGAYAAEKNTDVIRIDSGPISGKVEEGVRIFLGIPYAAAPIGVLRWKPPQEITSWTQVRTSTNFSPSCPQPNEQDTGKFNEDCLYLNVWSTAKSPDERLPVMLWLHGGAFNFGSASQPEYNGRNLAQKGVVVVTINYRLGPLGFLVHPLLSKESAHDTSGNYGLLDQIVALKWVQKNIAAFGGNPDRVTIFGQSAGSRSVSLLMISPLTIGLFFAPVFDSWVLPNNPLKAYLSGKQHNVPIIVGSTLNEGNIYLADETDLSLEKYKSFLKARFVDDSDKALAIFPAHDTKDVVPAIDKFLTVSANAQPARLVAQSMEKKKSKAYLYQFTRLPDTKLARKLGVHHGAELAYIFGNMNKADGYKDTDFKLSDKMMNYWVNFAITGNPNGRGLIHWPAYKSKTDINIEFSDTIHTNKHLYKKECDFISRFSAYRSE
jgi:para-nitrobenzyl esterase